jgi:hypothetical protein
MPPHHTSPLLALDILQQPSNHIKESAIAGKSLLPDTYLGLWQYIRQGNAFNLLKIKKNGIDVGLEARM